MVRQREREKRKRWRGRGRSGEIMAMPNQIKPVNDNTIGKQR